MGGRGSGRPKGSLNTKKRMRRESCMVDLEQLRQDLKTMIDLSDLTMDEFAEALGITERTLYTYLAHPGQMRVATLKNIEYLAGRKGATT